MTSSGQSTTSFAQSDVSIQVDVSNPCLTTTISGITFDPTSISVYDGSTATATFSIPGDGVDTSNSLTDLCGVKEYAIADNSNGNAISGWASIAASASTARQYVMTIDPSQYGSHISSDVTITVRVTTTFTTWTANSGT